MLTFFFKPRFSFYNIFNIPAGIRLVPVSHPNPKPVPGQARYQVPVPVLVPDQYWYCTGNLLVWYGFQPYDFETTIGFRTSFRLSSIPQALTGG